MPIPAQIKRLLIVKDGALLPLSFSALPMEDGTYLGQRFALATEPSAAFAWRPSRPSRPFAQLHSVVFTDPSGSPARPDASFLQASLNRIAWTAPLPFARQESQVLQQTFGDRNTRIFAGAAASRATALALDWTHYDVAHFATHAVFRETHPELSGLVLAPSQPPGQSAIEEVDYEPISGPTRTSLLSFYDVLQIKAPLQLVVLNACNSGMGKLLPGEGKLALDNAFLAAGAARVVATLWPVDDEASSVFMQHFYRALARTHSPLLSLQEAQSWMARSDDWSAPYYWGAFTLTGNWRPLSN
jgi:CHAT domain-containing protein